MLGALLAVGQRSHIRIDLIERIVPEQWKHYVNAFTNLVAGVVCFVLGITSIEFVLWEFEDQTASIGFIPSWILVTVIPFAAFAMGIRFTIQIFVKEE